MSKKYYKYQNLDFEVIFYRMLTLSPQQVEEGSWYLVIRKGIFSFSTEVCNCQVSKLLRSVFHFYVNYGSTTFLFQLEYVSLCPVLVFYVYVHKCELNPYLTNQELQYQVLGFFVDSWFSRVSIRLWWSQLHWIQIPRNLRIRPISWK